MTEQNTDDLQPNDVAIEQINYGQNFLKQIKAIKVLQRAFHRYTLNKQMDYALDSDIADNNARKALIRKFIIHFERTQREPIINVSQTERNEHMRQYCAQLILNALQARKRRLYIQLRIYEVYKLAALTILQRFRESPSARGEFYKLAKVLKIQRFARKIAYRQRFLRLKDQISKLSDPKITQPLQLIKLLDPQAASLLQSFGEGFALRFRLCQESDISNLQMTHSVQVAQKPKSRPGSKYGPQKEEINYKPRIFYKVFLHQHVCDVCETAPRDYATEALTMKEDRRLWYMRVTNQPWRALNGAALKQCVLDLKPTLTPNEVKYLKNYKQLKWREKLTKKWILAGIGVNENIYAEEKDTELDAFIKQLDYKAYETGWKDIGTNVFSLDTVKLEIQKVKMEEEKAMKNKIPRILYNSMQ